jgi:hypothetical protein
MLLLKRNGEGIEAPSLFLISSFLVDLCGWEEMLKMVYNMTVSNAGDTISLTLSANSIAIIYLADSFPNGTKQIILL